MKFKRFLSFAFGILISTAVMPTFSTPQAIFTMAELQQILQHDSIGILQGNPGTTEIDAYFYSESVVFSIDTSPDFLQFAQKFQQNMLRVATSPSDSPNQAFRQKCSSSLANLLKNCDNQTQFDEFQRAFKIYVKIDPLPLKKKLIFIIAQNGSNILGLTEAYSRLHNASPLFGPTFPPSPLKKLFITFENSEYANYCKDGKKLLIEQIMLHILKNHTEQQIVFI